MATIPNNNTFVNNGGGAAFGNPNITRQGIVSGANGVAGGGRGFVNPALAASADPSTPPPKAPAAQIKTNGVTASLVNALNQHQQDLVKATKQELADEYVIEFAPPDLAASQMKKQGQTNAQTAPMQNNNTAASVLNPTTNSIDYNTQGWQVTAGTQVVQLIDQVMRSSTYITSQQSVIVDEDGQCKPNPSSTNSTAWYKISVSATPLGYDHVRHDYAYRMRYVISPYAINQSASQYFPDSRYRGSHKSYNYWFTGLNTQILNFEQEYNNLYRLVISGIGQANFSNKQLVDHRDQFRRTYMPTSAQHTQGGNPDYMNEAGDNLMDFLCSPTDQAKCHLKIVGDPAWMQQGEAGPGIGPASNFSFQPFNADGGINYDSQQIVFDISWNRPTDYNLDTGTMDIQKNQYGEPIENITYTAVKCKSTFSKGRFEQELEGRALIEYNKTNTTAAATNGRPQTGSADSRTNIASTAIIGNTVINNLSLNNLSRQVNSLTTDASTWVTGLQKFQNSNPAPNSNSQTPPSNPGTQPAAPPEPPTSNGGIESTNGNTPQDQTDGQNTSDTSQETAQDDA